MIQTLFATALLIITLPGTCELLLLTIGAALLRKGIPRNEDSKGHVAVIIPAHNEELNICKTIESLKQSQGDCDIIVIADNCTDNTAEKALKMGARVIERMDLNHKGKNYALDFAFKKLLSEKYDIFAVVDADTTVKRNFVSTIQSIISLNIPVIQTRYDILNSKNRLKEVVQLAFNFLRPTGREYWGLSTGLLGNGFAMHKQVLKQVPYTVNSIVEDLAYHIKLVEHGYRVHFITETGVYSTSPENREGELSQRQRWEGGRLKELFRIGPGLVYQILRGNFILIEPLLDLMLLPLSYHTCLLVLLLLISVGPLQICGAISLCIVIFHYITAILLSDEKIKNFLSLISAPAYMLWKLRILPKILWSAIKSNAWIRTSRDIK